MKKNYKTLSAIALLAATSLTATAQRKDDVESHSQYLTAVDEYRPAPGQFVNIYPKFDEGDNEAKIIEKCTNLLKGAPKDREYSLVTLGSFGGYITFHFDHSIANIEGAKDFVVRGNAYENGSEPGIVMVSKDTNGNGLPDDEWFELAGSAQNPTYGYSITYSRNEQKTTDWTDSQGESGTMKRAFELDDDGNEIPFHDQDYYPMWIPADNYTLAGTRLPDNGVQTSTSPEYWRLDAFEWGYVDNLVATDVEGSSFDISWAVDSNRNPVKLDFVDFVRVYTALNQECGWLGETSTEVVGSWDLHLDQSLATIDEAMFSTVDFEDYILQAESSWNGSNMTGEKITDEWGAEVCKNIYQSNGFRFTNLYNPQWGSWAGMAISNMTANNFVDYTTSQYNNCIGSGYNGSANFGVFFPSASKAIEVVGNEDQEISGFYITNSAWNVKAYLEGDGQTDGCFATGDWCKLTITATRSDNTTANVDVYLADYRSDNAAEHRYINNWQWVDLSSLGKIRTLAFAVSSSRNNEWGMTTPGYFCMDNFNGVADENAISENTIARTTTAVEVARYTIDGKLIHAPQRGINIIRMSDGSMRKVVVK